MSRTELIPSLMFFTIGAIIVVALVLLLRFLRKRSNRHPMEGVRERNIDEIRAGTPPRREP